MKKPLSVWAVKALSAQQGLRPSFCMHHPSQLDRFTVCSVLSKCELTLPTLPTENNSVFDQGCLPPPRLAQHTRTRTHAQMYTCIVSPHTVCLSASGSRAGQAWIHEFLITQSVGWSIIQFYLWASMSGSNLTCTSLGLPLTRWVPCPWAGLGLCLCGSVCSCVCWLAGQAFVSSQAAVVLVHRCVSASSVHGRTRARALGHSALQTVHYFNVACVFVCQCETAQLLAKLMCLYVCVFVWAYAWSVFPSRRLDKSKTWISLKGIEPAERSAAKFSD